MKRDELRAILEGLNPTDEMIDKIMNLNGTDINTAKAAAKSDLDKLQEQLKERDKDIADLKKNPDNSAELTQKLNDLQTKYDTDTKALQAQIDKRNYSDAIKNAISEKGIRFTSKSAERYFLSQAESKQLKLENGKLIGFDDFHREQLEADKSAFLVDDTNKEAPSNTSNGQRLRFAGPSQNGEKQQLSLAEIAAQKFNKMHNVPPTAAQNTNAKG